MSLSVFSGRLLFDIYPETATRGIRECYESALDGSVTVLSHGLHRFLLALPPSAGYLRP